MMKRHTNLILPLIGLGLAAGCGGYGDKVPLKGKDLANISKNNETVITKGKAADQPRVVKEAVYTPRDRIVEKIKIEYKVVEKPVDRLTVVGEVLSISTDPEMSFTEGREGKFKVRARVLTDANVSFKLALKDLPKEASGAKLVDLSSDKEQGVYEIQWTPPFSTVSGTDMDRTLQASVEIQLGAVTNKEGKPDEALKKALETLPKKKQISLRVYRDRTPPSEVKIEGLPGEIQGGTIVPFHIIAKVPGVDQSSRGGAPTLDISYDGVSTTPGNNFLEMDGAAHVIADTSKKSAEYLGDFKWKFNRLFDTKNIEPKPQLDSSGKVLASADGTRVRFSYKVKSPADGPSSAATVKQIKIKYLKPLNLPRFDISMNRDSLDITLGRTTQLYFSVESAIANSTFKVTGSELAKLPGKATLNCVATKPVVGSRSSCMIEWSVPCDASDAQLNRDLTLEAKSSLNGSDSETVQQVIKVVKAKDISACQASTQKEAK